MALLEKNTHIHATHEKRFSSMKKILSLLFLLAPLYTYGQTWFTADAGAVIVGNNDAEWQECRNRICVLSDGNVKIFTAENTFVYSRIGEHFTKDEGNGISYMSWPCIDEEGERCALSFNNIEGDNFFILEYSNYSIMYHVIPDD